MIFVTPCVRGLKGKGSNNLDVRVRATILQIVLVVLYNKSQPNEPRKQLKSYFVISENVLDIGHEQFKTKNCN